MKRKLMVVVLALVLVFTFASPALAEGERREYYKSGDDGAVWGARSNYSVAQSFETESSYDIVSIRVKTFRAGSPGTINVGITEIDSEGRPRGGWLTSGVFNSNTMTENAGGEWYEITMASYHLSEDTEYAIVIEVPNGNASNTIWWREDGPGDDILPTYRDGSVIDMDDGVWRDPDESRDRLFQIYGVEWYAYTENDIDALIKRLAGEVRTLESQVSDLDSQIESLNSQVDRFGGVESRLVSNLGALIGDRFATLENEVLQVRNEVTGLRGKAEAVEGTTANIWGEVVGIRDKVEGVEGLRGLLTSVIVITLASLVAIIMFVIMGRKVKKRKVK